MDLQAAIISAVHFAIGACFFVMAQGIPNRIKGTWGHVLSWPCYGIAFIFVGSAVFNMLMTMFAPYVAWVWNLFR